MSAIAVEGVGKRYVISHQRRHDTLRDTIVHGVRGLFSSVPGGHRPDEEEFWALRDVSLHIAPGEIVGIVGRNGAGKSTLLKVLSRITEPTEGRVTINGRIASLLEVGTGFHPELSGRENIFLNGAILGMSRAEIRRKFDEIVAFAEVERFLDTPVKRYSSGMYVRLAFAVAAHLDPEILIVDEVLAVGDAAFQKKCLGKMSEVAGNGRTILFVSHNMTAVGALCQKVALLEAGRLRHYGPVAETLGAYLRADGAKDGYFEPASTPPPSRIQITSVELRNDVGVRAGTIQNGRDCTLGIGYHRSAGFAEPVIPSLRVTTQTGAPVFHHHSRLNKIVFDRLPMSGRFEFSIPRLPLPAASYLLHVALVSNNEVVDEREQVLEFSVVDGPFYTAGETTPASLGLVLVEGAWKSA
jgi:lipopolysaccharide transport system ATP-binding protein